MSDKYKMTSLENFTVILPPAAAHLGYGPPISILGKPQVSIALDGKEYTVISWGETDEPGAIQGKMKDSKGEVFTYRLKAWGEFGDSLMDEFKKWPREEQNE